MLEPILAWQELPERGCEDDFFLRIESVARDGDDSLWTIAGFTEPGPEASRWRVRARAVRALRLDGPGIASRLELASEHPLLLPHTARRTELYVGTGPRDSATLLGDLWRAHRRVTDGWIRTEEYFNGGYGLFTGDVGAGFGLLAEGPRPLLEAYAAVAGDHGMRPNLLGDSPPLRQLDHHLVEDVDVQLHVMLLGASWCVAEDFTCERA